MVTTNTQSRRPLSRIDRGILALHGLVAAGVGVAGFIGANDPDWGDVQRLVIVMLIGLWAGGIAIMAVLARLVSNPWGRAAVLLAGPFAGIALVFGRSMLGWS